MVKMEEKKVFRSMDEIKEHYYPIDYLNSLSIAERVMREIRPEIDEIFEEYNKN